MLVFSLCVTFIHQGHIQSSTSSTVIHIIPLHLSKSQTPAKERKIEPHRLDRQSSTPQNTLYNSIPHHHNHNHACSSKVLPPRLCRLHGLRPNLHHHRRLKRRRRRRRRPHALATATRTSPKRLVWRHGGAEREQVRKESAWVVSAPHISKKGRCLIILLFTFLSIFLLAVFKGQGRYSYY